MSLIEALINTWVPFSPGAIEIKQAPPAVALIKRFEYINSNSNLTVCISFSQEP